MTARSHTRLRRALKRAVRNWPCKVRGTWRPQDNSR